LLPYCTVPSRAVGKGIKQFLETFSKGLPFLTLKGAAFCNNDSFEETKSSNKKQRRNLQFQELPEFIDSYAVTYDDTPLPLPHPCWSQTGWELD
jgi:hypothetical protein